ncbi:helix-turn-helix domain-containing protein [Carboxylicivirga linearis]|uniref:Helix-turn-helix transcriptional regulator n=1 Tax=Carboxylicivirga linearis TaxID=1628157 RepID=A0ABS5K1H8_9BACT|nr:helix-turn-helix transcriptional regulator [Carboxylicivirga linearis]MBS2100978.1 helix-turn-helix transcriptional regulator [Carboxylicivirga linearis]
MTENTHHIYKSISELHSSLNLPKPTNPLVSVIKLEDLDSENGGIIHSITYNFYSVFLKKNFDGKIKYGHQYYDFDEGTMTFYAPKQKVVIEDYTPTKLEGWMLVFHPDFLHGYSLSKKMNDYGFFLYAVNEALHVSESEELIISGVFQNLKNEIKTSIDNFTQDVVVSHIDLLLTYCNRFYNRQFITRKKPSKDLLIKFEEILNDYFHNEESTVKGLPSVQYFSEKLFVSSHYLNDMLKCLTGQTTQQHIQNQLIEKAKELLSTTSLSISEIAYGLGFEYSQSFSKLFKNKTNLTPQEFRNSFN